MSALYLRLALPSPLRRLFDYLPGNAVDPMQLQPGIRIKVPFANRELIGILVEVVSHSEVPQNKLKPIVAVLDQTPLIPKSLFSLCQWSAKYYHHSLGDTFNWALPVLLRQGEAASKKPSLFWHALPEAQVTDPAIAKAPKQQHALAILLQHPQGLAHTQLGQFGLSKDLLDKLASKQLAVCREQVFNLAQKPRPTLAQPELTLNEQQQAALAAILDKLQQFQVFLLAGVTGSGKTEVYLQAIQHCLAQGQQVLVLIPEINLGPQTIQRFSQRFKAKIALLNSEVNDRQRLDGWIEANSGEADIVIGTRSALFTPMPNLGLIIIDEEHDSSYKQQEGLRYHARDVAIVRAMQAKIPIVLGSATPSLESLYNAEQGRYTLLKLTQRAGQAAEPSFIRLDIKHLPLDAGISQALQKEMRQTLAAGQQVLVFLNRRGFAPVLMCHDCGWISHCHACDARLTLHQRYNELRCHHCGHIEPRPHHCPKCQHLDLRPIGSGTERTEERLAIMFPDTPVLRIDRDSTARKGALQGMLEIINQGQPCILLGTQMLAKGHHFPKVTLVAILNADGGLFSADFRASEYMAQQILQVAGRAGRAAEPGRVIIQSHLADHPLLVQLTEQGYFAFAKQALEERRHALMPPFSHLVLLRAESVKPEQGHLFLEQAHALAEQLQLSLDCPEVELLGPVPAPMERRQGRHRAQLLLLSTQRTQLHCLVNALVHNLEPLPSARSVRWSVDVDPIELF